MPPRTRTLSLLIAAAVFFAPINLFFKWGEAQAYVGGIFSDYLVGKVWLGEIPVLAVLLLWLPSKIRANFSKIIPFLKKNMWLLLAGLVLLVRQFFSPLPIISLLSLARLLELMLFFWCLRDLWPAINAKLLYWAVLAALLFQSGVALAQFFRQQPLFEYSVLGETQFTGAINIARVDFRVGEKTLPYGTTAHPNILAGVVVLLTIIWLRSRSRKQLAWKELMLVALVSAVLFLTQSYTAIAAFALFLLMESFPLLKKQAVSLALMLLIAAPLSLLLAPADWLTQSLSRRLFLNGAAAMTLIKQPLLGTGLGMFTNTLSFGRQTFNELIRFVQPVHNIILLWLTETGLIGLALVAALVKKISRAVRWEWLLVLAPIISFDHYLLTQWAGGVLFVFFLFSWLKPAKQ